MLFFDCTLWQYLCIIFSVLWLMPHSTSMLCCYAIHKTLFWCLFHNVLYSLSSHVCIVVLVIIIYYCHSLFRWFNGVLVAIVYSIAQIVCRVTTTHTHTDKHSNDVCTTYLHVYVMATMYVGLRFGCLMKPVWCMFLSMDVQRPAHWLCDSLHVKIRIYSMHISWKGAINDFCIYSLHSSAHLHQGLMNGR